MNVCSFTSEAAMNEALRWIWIEYVREKVAAGITARDDSGTFYNKLDGLVDNEIGELKLCGKMKGNVVTDNGTTTRYGDGIKAYDLDKWYFSKPPDKYLVNVTGHTIEPYDQAWEYPDEI